MLHPVERPPCIDALTTVVGIQLKLLKVARDEDIRIIDVLRRHFSNNEIDWLWHHKQKLLDPLRVFIANLDTIEKNGIIAAFKHDLSYVDHVDDDVFEFSLLPKATGASATVQSVGKWLENFYDIFVKWGIPRLLTGYHIDINQQVLLEEYNTINRNMRVCPVCDGTWMEKGETGIVGSVDHFLPRSSYPALSMHPSNLLPICVVCNEKFKGHKDPLTEGEKRIIARSFHYHLRPARSSISLEVNTSGGWVFKGNGSVSSEQISCFTSVFNLPKRWEGRADEIDRIVRRRIRDRIDAWKDVTKNMPLPPTDKSSMLEKLLVGVLDDLDRKMENEWGETSLLYPATWWMRFLRQKKWGDLVNEILNTY